MVPATSNSLQPWVFRCTRLSLLILSVLLAISEVGCRRASVVSRGQRNRIRVTFNPVRSHPADDGREETFAEDGDPSQDGEGELFPLSGLGTAYEDVAELDPGLLLNAMMAKPLCFFRMLGLSWFRVR